MWQGWGLTVKSPIEDQFRRGWKQMWENLPPDSKEDLPLQSLCWHERRRCQVIKHPREINKRVRHPADWTHFAQARFYLCLYVWFCMMCFCGRQVVSGWLQYDATGNFIFLHCRVSEGCCKVDLFSPVSIFHFEAKKSVSLWCALLISKNSCPFSSLTAPRTLSKLRQLCCVQGKSRDSIRSVPWLRPSFNQHFKPSVLFLLIS